MNSWNKKKKTLNQLIVIGSFIYDFLSIHPFKMGTEDFQDYIDNALFLQNNLHIY